ncbi:MAG: (Fe-S)-binding protein, partial [Planctomycetota bacterium]
MSVPIIPEDAPFDAEQRAWLNGFFAGWIGVEGANSRAPAAAEALLKSPPANGAANAEAPPQAESSSSMSDAAVSDASAGGHAAYADDEEDFPWHDESLDIGDRMKLAEDRAPRYKLMAAMAQLDCGACGYMCDTYAYAIADGEEKDLTLCSPGGRETARMLKKLAKEGLSAAPAARGGTASSGAAAKATTAVVGGAAAGGSAAVAVAEPVLDEEEADEEADLPPTIGRRNPVRAKVLKVENLNGAGSAKHTVHVELGLNATNLTYRVGDSLGVYPTNCPDLVEEILALLRAHGTEHVV